MGFRSKVGSAVAFAQVLGRLFIRRREMVGYYQKHYLKYAFRDVDFRNLIKDEFNQALDLRFAPDQYGDMSWGEIVVISALTAHFRPMRIFEFGTFMGKTTYHLAANSPGESQVFTLDLPEENFEETIKNIPYDMQLLEAGKRKKVGHYVLNSPYKNKVTQLFSHSASFDETPYANSMDMIFIDADHTYPSVLNDTRKALKMLKNGAAGKIILWHDLRQGNDIEKVIAKLCGHEKTFHIKETMLGIYIS